MRVGATIDPGRSTNGRPRRTSRARLTFFSILAMLAGLLAAAGSSTPVQAAQAPGHDVPAWSNGWSWTYQTTFRYQADGTDVTINETVTYTVANPEPFNGHDAYKMNITGTITGGSGTTRVDGVGTATLSNFSGNVTGTRFVRRSDLALLEETQHQSMKARASVSLFSTDITADIDLRIAPSPSWKTHDFPLNPGDTWQHNETINYDGGFSYDAGSYGSGADTFDGALPFVAPASVSASSVGVPIGNVAVDLIAAQSADGQTVDNHWYSPSHKNDARHLMVLPLDEAKLTITRNLSAASVPAPSPSLTAVATPSLTCAGGVVTVAGTLGSFASGIPVSIALDQSQINPGQRVTASTTTGAGGSYSAILTAPNESDGLNKVGSRANWGVTVTAGSARAATTVVVTPQNCSSIAYTGATSAPHGSNATVSAKLTDLGGGSPSGRQVTFALAGGGSLSATTNGSGVATATLPVNGPPRTSTITASWAGNASLAAASTQTPFTVGKVATTTTVAPSESPATVGEPVTFTAHVSPSMPGSPTGGVQFAVDGADFGAPVPLVSGAATSSAITFNTIGSRTVTATYVGDNNYAASTSPIVTFQVRAVLLATTTTATVSPTTIVYGESVHLGATVAATGGGDTPTGTVTFTDGGTTLGTATLGGSGAASLDVSGLGVGAHSIVATYSGDDVYRASAAAPKNLTVTKADVEVALSSSDTTTLSGEGVDYSVVVTPIAPGGGVPDGMVQLVIDGADVGSPIMLEGGVAIFPTVTSLLTGNHTVTARYAGSANFKDGSDSLQQQVAQADTTTLLTASPSPSAEGQNVTFTANVSAVAPGSGAPTGTVTFETTGPDGEVIGAAPLQAGPGGSEASVSTGDLSPGSYGVVARYSGDTGYASSEATPLSHTVIAGAAIVPTVTVATASANPSTYGELISFSAQVTAEDGSVPSGLVQFSVDGSNVGAPVALDAQGVAESPAIGSPDPGDHSVIAAFRPDPGFGSSGDIITQTVAAAGVDLTVEPSVTNGSYGEAVSFTATAVSQQAGTGKPTGFVQFTVDGKPLGNAVALDDGTATSPAATDLAPGSHAVSVLYSGDIHFAPALTSLTQDVAKIGTTTTLLASPTSSIYGQPVELTATVAPAHNGLGAPGGTVRFVEGGTTLATVPVTPASGGNGSATYTVVGLGGGSHEIKAVYSGTSEFQSSESAGGTVAVAKRATIMDADAAVVKLLPLGLPIGHLRTRLTSTQGAVAGAPVEFRIGGTVACVSTTDANGVATCNASAYLVQLILSNGYRATFPGDANYLSSSDNGPVLK